MVPNHHHHHHHHHHQPPPQMITAIASITNIPAGNLIPAIQGMVTKIYPDRKEGTNAYGPWSIQKAVFRGTDGESITLKFCDFDVMDNSWCNVPLRISQPDNPKAKALLIEDYQGKKSLKVASSAELEWNPDPANAPPPQRQGPPQQQEPPPQQQQHAQGPPQQQQHAQGPPQQQQQQQQHAQSGSDDAYREARKFLTQCSVMWTTCYDAAAAAAWGVYDRHGQIVVGAGVGVMADKFFIEAARRGMIQTMPVIDPATLPRKCRKVSELMALFELVRGPAFTPHGTPGTPGTPATPATPGTPPPRSSTADAKPPGYPSVDDDEIPF